MTYSSNQAPPKIAILLCTYNGAEYLAEQLDSIEAQSWENIDVWASDDGSSDNTMGILYKYQENWRKGRFEVKQGPRKGFQENFLSLVCNSNITADFYAFSDQDDVWESDKLARAFDCLKERTELPALYCSRTALIAECGKSLNRMSPLFSRPPSFTNALVQNIAGGNTMVMNKKAHTLLCTVGKQNIVSHDWWVYLLITGAGGYIYYDSVPSIQYRQHSDNEIGANVGLLAKLKRLRGVLKGNFSDWNTLHVEALNNNCNVLTKENLQTLNYFKKSKNAPLFKRILFANKSGIYRQTVEGNIALWIAVVLNKI